MLLVRNVEKIIPLFIIFVGFFVFGIVGIGLMQDAEENTRPVIEDGATIEQVNDYEKNFELSGLFIKIFWVVMVVVLALLLGVGVGKFLHMF